MKAFAANARNIKGGLGAVTVLNLVCGDLEKDRVEIRDGLSKQLGTVWIWFEDEIGTIYDPVKGPNPLFGPKACN